MLLRQAQDIPIESSSVNKPGIMPSIFMEPQNPSFLLARATLRSPSYYPAIRLKQQGRCPLNKIVAAAIAEAGIVCPRGGKLKGGS